MTHNTTRLYPDRPCKCGGIAAFIGLQRYAVLNFQQPLFLCHACGTSIGGEREPLTQVSEPVERPDSAAADSEGRS